MASTADRALSLAENALTRRLAEHVHLDSAGYCPRAEDNLIATVGPGVWHRARRRDLAGGKGDELAGKFRAPYSSSALAVNTFSPLLNGVSLTGSLQVDGAIAFEQQRSAWAGGYWPTLDLIVEEEQRPVRLFVEANAQSFCVKDILTSAKPSSNTPSSNSTQPPRRPLNSSPTTLPYSTHWTPASSPNTS